jgi:hypothetical protein
VIDLLTIYRSQLQITVTLSLISTLNKLLHAKSSQFTITNRFLVTDLNNEDSPASVITSLLSDEYPATELSQSKSKSKSHFD